MSNHNNYHIALIILLCSSYLYPQIDTISVEDFKHQYTINNQLHIFWDNNTPSVNIGSAGSSSWDFSNLTSDLNYTANIIHPVNTPFRPDYPSSHFSWEYESEDLQEHNWEYYCRSSNIHLHGLVFTSLTDTLYQRKVYYIPIFIYAPLPMTLNSTRRDSLVETTVELRGPDTLSFNQVTVVTRRTVDAHGPITFPGGKTVDALRVKSRQTKYTGTDTEEKIIYQWFSEDGEMLSFETDTSSPDNGIVNVSSNIRWILNTLTTDIEDENTFPKQFILKQNYPNPFNPSTSIRYSIPGDSHIRIKVFNTIGKEIMTLADERRSAGMYTASFNGDGLPSGIYFLQMTADGKEETFHKVIKMTLIK